MDNLLFIKKIDSKSLAKFYMWFLGTIYFIIAMIIGIIFIITNNLTTGLAIIGGGILVGFFGGLLGFLLGIFIAYIINIFLNKSGGIGIYIEKKEK